MNLQQLEYIIAVDKLRHFAKAAESCHVTQPTLSMMIQKLEEEFDIIIFNRGKQPVEPTAQGNLIIEQARIILGEVVNMKELVKSAHEEIKGTINLDIIPTLGSYLIPLFVNNFMQKYPELNLIIEENNTDNIIERLKKGWSDLAILATPLREKALQEVPLFYEELYFYSGAEAKKSISAAEIDPDELLILEEGHCLRSQIMNLCNIKEYASKKIHYKSGSLETLKRLVENNQGNTILPELATKNLTPENRIRLTRFEKPYPVREVSLVFNKNFPRRRLIGCLKDEILSSVPKKMNDKKFSLVLEIKH
jgi:LysR family hydrogen peroxide-inducible transcriptional activator